MKVLVLGATGGVGRHIVEQGRKRGYELSALVRDPSRLPFKADGIHVLGGDVLDADAVDQATRGQDAVICTIGVRTTGPTTLFSDATRVLLPAMERHHVRRLVCITGVGAGETKGHGGLFYDWFIFPLFTRHRYQDKDKQEATIRGSSLDWIIVRPAPFREGDTANELTAVTDVDGVTLRRVSRSEVAAFVLDQLESNRFLRQAVFIGHP